MALALTGCASLFNPSESEVQLQTKPEQSRCELTGLGGFAMTVSTPATVAIPHSAAPVTVACSAPGYKRTVNSLHASGSGWIWANSAFVIATTGVAALGLVVDEALGSNRTYQKDVTVELEVEAKRPVRARSRDGVHDLNLEAR